MSQWLHPDAVFRRFEEWAESVGLVRGNREYNHAKAGWEKCCREVAKELDERARVLCAKKDQRGVHAGLEIRDLLNRRIMGYEI